jgi:regulator of protease activity HflC (stomatin/prohibitin superfamily)
MATIYVALFIPEIFVAPILLFGDRKATTEEAVAQQVWAHYWHFVLFLEIVYNLLAIIRKPNEKPANPLPEGMRPSFFLEQTNDEVGAILLFGRYLYTTSPGLIYRPPGITRHRRDSILIQQWEIPKDIPELYDEDEKSVLRMTSAPAQNAVKADDPNADPLATGRLTLSVTCTVSARLDTKPGAYRAFIERIGTIRNFLQITDDVVVRRLRQEVIRRTPSSVLSEWEDLERGAQQRLKDRVGNFGFAELDLGVKKFDLPKRVNEALADRTKEFINVESQRLAGQATLARDTLVAKAKRLLKSAELNGTIDALKRAQMEKGGLGLTQSPG